MDMARELELRKFIIVWELATLFERMTEKIRKIIKL
jgi:hypothetical protein